MLSGVNSRGYHRQWLICPLTAGYRVVTRAAYWLVNHTKGPPWPSWSTKRSNSQHTSNFTGYTSTNSPFWQMKRQGGDSALRSKCLPTCWDPLLLLVPLLFAPGHSVKFPCEDHELWTPDTLNWAWNKMSTIYQLGSLNGLLMTHWHVKPTQGTETSNHSTTCYGHSAKMAHNCIGHIVWCCKLGPSDPSKLQKKMDINVQLHDATRHFNKTSQFG